MVVRMRIPDRTLQVDELATVRAAGTVRNPFAIRTCLLRAAGGSQPCHELEAGSRLASEPSRTPTRRLLQPPNHVHHEQEASYVRL